MVQHSHSCMTTGKTIALTIQAFVAKVMSLLFNTLFRFVVAFLSRNKCIFNFMAAVIICSDCGAQEYKICHCFPPFPFYLPWSDGKYSIHVNYSQLEGTWTIYLRDIFERWSFELKNSFPTGHLIPNRAPYFSFT